jgi:tRNA pseudouridine55 synthase
MQLDFEKGTVLLVNKPLTWTSFDVTNKIKYLVLRQLNIQLGLLNGKKRKIKVGHAGTLDPLATGLLIVCVGKETKQINLYMGQEKEYTGTICFGASRPSFDKETEIDQSVSMPLYDTSTIQSAANSFLGEIEQIPPVYSAIKVNGKRAYQSARAGEELEMKARQVEVKAFEIIQNNWPLVHFRIVCSKGTYIRSLAHDLGKKLGGLAYLDSLCRTRIGNFELKSANSIENLQKEWGQISNIE